MPELAEGARLEIVCSANPGTVGSNPTLSAILFILNAVSTVTPGWSPSRLPAGMHTLLKQRMFSEMIACD
jgi:hypothetical protein